MSTSKKLFIFIGLWVVLYVSGFILGGFGGWFGILGALIFITLGAFFIIDAFKTKRAKTIFVICFVILLSCLAFLFAIPLLR